jgi:ATP-dependent RNA helicase DHX8/PRP22
MRMNRHSFRDVQSRFSIDMSPVKVFKNPEGSLSIAAALQSTLIKERLVRFGNRS